jgi:hypothetical protein
MRFSEELNSLHAAHFVSTSPESETEADGLDNSQLARAPLFSTNVARHLGTTPFDQYGMLGIQQFQENGDMQSHEAEFEKPNLIYGNHGEPWSAFICGSQGSGKSHTLANLLENCVLPNHTYGNVPNPLTAIAFHYDSFTSFYSTQHCELAYFCSAGIKVRVLVSPDNLGTMARLYSQLPGLPPNAPRPEVFPMKLHERQLNSSNMMTLMNVQDSAHTPLYLSTLTHVLRKLKEEQGNRPGINYDKFRAELDAQDFNTTQNQMLALRLQLLDQCLDADILTKKQDGKEVQQDIWSFEPGTLTIVDLSSEFVNAGDACALFTVCLDLFMSKRREAGRVLVLDEAHKVSPPP